jgi:GH24 family phage-related lysozyme (muramidase)
MPTSQAGKAFIVTNEGTCLTIKPDNRGPQIGHGHDLTPDEIASGSVYGIPVGDGITLEQADFILDQDMETVYDPALNCLQVQGLIPDTVTQNQWDAIADFIYNEGGPNTATMLHHGWDQVPIQMPRWIWEEVNGVEQQSAGLAGRRAKEVALFNTPVE